MASRMHHRRTIQTPWFSSQSPILGRSCPFREIGCSCGLARGCGESTLGERNATDPSRKDLEATFCDFIVTQLRHAAPAHQRLGPPHVTRTLRRCQDAPRQLMPRQSSVRPLPAGSAVPSPYLRGSAVAHGCGSAERRCLPPPARCAARSAATTTAGLAPDARFLQTGCTVTQRAAQGRHTAPSCPIIPGHISTNAPPATRTTRDRAVSLRRAASLRRAFRCNGPGETQARARGSHPNRPVAPTVATVAACRPAAR